jgi:diguanylate cyclase
VLSENWLYFLLSALLGAGLTLVALGMARVRLAKATAPADPAQDDGSGFLSSAHREEMLGLLQQLTSWASEYSGTVSQYQHRLGSLAKEVQEEAVGSSRQSVPRVASLLSEIMQNNASLQHRLEAAEKQLDRQTRQIESYLSEARTDGLTRLANRRSFDAKIEEMFAAYRKGGKSFVLAMIDIDHFKRINDTYGHQAGDEVLVFVAAALRQSLDGSYLVARYGGEEFAAIMPAPLRLAADRIDAMRKSLSQERIAAAGEELQITLSSGLSEPREELVAAHLIRRADEALYAAKKMGRDRVYYHDGRQCVLLGAPELAGPT